MSQVMLSPSIPDEVVLAVENHLNGCKFRIDFSLRGAVNVVRDPLASRAR